MSIKHQVMGIVMEIIQKRPVKSYDLTDMGFSRTATNSALTQLVRDKKIYRHGHARASYYTLSKKPVSLDEKPKKENQEITLPEIPQLLLNWMGYTNIKPHNPVHIHGCMSRGAD